MKISWFLLLAFGQLVLIALSASAGHYFSLWENTNDVDVLFPLILTLVIAFSIAYVVTMFSHISLNSNRSVNQIGKDVEDLRRFVTCLAEERANVYPLEEAYERMSYAVAEAKHSVTLLTRHRYNKEKKQTNIPMAEQNSRNKMKYYEAMLKAIESQKINFKRLIQVDTDLYDNWHEPISKSFNLSKEIIDIYLNKDGKAPQARIYIIQPKLDMSFILIDNKKLFFNIFSVIDGEYSSPYMFYIESERGNLPHLNEIFEQYVDGIKSISVQDAIQVKNLGMSVNNNTHFQS